MTPFVLPITVRTADADIDLVLDLPGPVPLGDVLPEIVLRSGLPPGTTLNLGVGAVEPSWVLGRAPLLAGRVLSTRPAPDAGAVGPLNLSCIAGPDAGRSVPLDGEPIVIGRASDCDLTLDDPELSRRHARIQLGADGLVVTDLQSCNGIKVDGRDQARAGPPESIPAGALIRLGASVLRSGLDAEPSLLLTPDGAGHLAVARPARVAPAFDFFLPPAPGSPPVRTRRPIPLLAAVIGAVAGTAIAFVTGMWTFLLLAVLGPLMMLATAFSDRIGGRRGHRRATKDYAESVVERNILLQQACVADRLDAWDRYPDPATLVRRAASASSRLWERRPSDPDFLRLAVGIGERPARLGVEHPPMISEIPITIDLAAIGVLGVTGPCRGLVRLLLGQLAVLHSPTDLQLHVFSDQPDLLRIRDLPHTVELHRNPSKASDDVARMLWIADDLVRVVVLDDAHRWRRTPRMNELLSRAARPATAASGLSEWSTTGRPRSPIAAICIADRAEALPVECTAIAIVSDGRVHIRAGAQKICAETAGVSRAYLDRLVGSLAPLVDPDAPCTGLPADVPLSALLGPEGITAAAARRWTSPSLLTSVGVGRAGSVEIDLERDGPHLLIAGTTGSGKSELLQTLIAGLACAAPPERTAFLLVDYKGGAAFGRLADLPHTTGLITDLDQGLAARALASLRAEVRKRERILAQAGVPDLAGLRGIRPADCPPSLVIFVDEFATLGAERPEFLVGLLDVAQRGRSLGLHLVLATQRPAGVLSPAMKANIGLRICLRVTDDSDSVDVIDTPEAARLPITAPGRAYIRREKARTTLFQVARVSGVGQDRPRVRLRDHDGRPGTVIASNVAARPGLTDRSGLTELDDLVESVTVLARGRPRPSAPWLPALPPVYQAADHIFGLRDEPEDQRQVELRLPTGSTLVLGPPGSGRSCALRRLARCAGHAGAEIVVVDPSGGLRDLDAWPGTRTYLDGQDPFLVQRLIDRLRVDLRSRPSGVADPILLVVDGWEGMIGPLDGLDYGASAGVLTDLAGRGPTAGISLAVSGEVRLQHHRISSSFTTVLRLGPDDDGRALLTPPGRGRMDRIEVQVAHATAKMPPPPAPSHGAAPVVRPLPDRVPAAVLPPARPGAVPLGLGGDDASVQCVDFTGPGGGLLVTGPRRSGVSSALTLLAIGAAAAQLCVVRATLRPALPLRGVQDVDLRHGIDPLRELLVAHQGPILLLADGVGSGGWPEDACALLERFVTVAGPAQYLAIGVRLDQAARAHRGLIAEVVAFRSGILLQPDSPDGSLFDTRIPKRTQPSPPGRGYLVLGGRATPLQLARPTPADTPGGRRQSPGC